MQDDSIHLLRSDKVGRRMMRRFTEAECATVGATPGMYSGTILAHDSSTAMNRVLYDDGDVSTYSDQVMASLIQADVDQEWTAAVSVILASAGEALTAGMFGVDDEPVPEDEHEPLTIQYRITGTRRGTCAGVLPSGSEPRKLQAVTTDTVAMILQRLATEHSVPVEALSLRVAGCDTDPSHDAVFTTHEWASKCVDTSTPLRLMRTDTNATAMWVGSTMTAEHTAIQSWRQWRWDW